jgi:hypothetical protein
MSQFERSWRRYVDAWETPPPPENPAPNPETTPSQSGGSGESTWVLSRDEWERHQADIANRLETGFGGIREWMTSQNPPPEGEGEHVSSSEETPEVTEIEVQDRQIVRKQSPRMNLSFGQILRRLAQ